MSSQPTILLYALETIGMIIPHPSGVIYQQQTGGYSCIQDRVEGVFVPLFDIHGQTAELERFFTGHKWRGACDHGIDLETADFVDGILGKVPGYSGIKVDRRRIADSHESWVYVTCESPETTGVLEGFEPRSAILTWPNSD